MSQNITSLSLNGAPGIGDLLLPNGKGAPLDGDLFTELSCSGTPIFTRIHISRASTASTLFKVIHAIQPSSLIGAM